MKCWGFPDGSSISRRDVFSFTSGVVGILGHSSSQALDVTIHLPDIPNSMPEMPRGLPMPSLPSMPQAPTVPSLDEVVNAVPIPEMLKNESQRAIDTLSVYIQPLSDLQRELSRMKEGSIEFEDRSLVVRIVERYFSITQRPSLLSSMDQVAPLIGGDGEGLELAFSMKAESRALLAAVRAEDLPAQKAAAKALARLLKEAISLLDGTVPPPATIGNGKFLGVISASLSI